MLFTARFTVFRFVLALVLLWLLLPLQDLASAPDAPIIGYQIGDFSITWTEQVFNLFPDTSTDRCQKSAGNSDFARYDAVLIFVIRSA